MSTQLLTEVMEKIVLLSDDERNSLLNFLTEQNLKTSKIPATQSDIFRSREMEWIKQYHSKYAGQWVALDGDRLICHGPDGRKVYTEARKQVAVPFVVHLEDKDVLPFGGW